MRLRKPDSELVRAAGGTLETIVREAVSVGREMVRIPAELFMRVAEAAGAAVLAGWRAIWPVLAAAGGALGRGYGWLERAVTPARAAVAAAGGVALLLALSQFAALRSVGIGAPGYSGVEEVARAPAVELMDVGEAHLWLGIPLAVVAAAVIARAATGRWQAARLLVAVGVAVLALTFAVDLPKGLDEGDAAVAYEGASAKLLGGFWMQLACGIVLLALAPLLVRLLEPGARRAAELGPRRAQPLLAGLPRLPRPPRGGRSPRVAVREVR